MRTRSRVVFVLLLVVLGVGLLSTPAQTAPWHSKESVEPMTEPVVVRLYYGDQDHLNQVAGDLDIWEVHREEKYAIAMVVPAEYQWLESLGYRIEIDAEKTELLGVQAILDPRFHYFDSYFTNPNGLYVANLLQSVQMVHPELTELIDIGNAWIGDDGGYNRDIWVLRITSEDPAYGPIEDKPVFFLFATIHAREVANAELVIRYIKYLLDGFEGEGGYGVDPDATWLVNHNVAYILVMQNPDGHWVNEQNTSAYRRKNMNDNECAYGEYGIDLNRNHSFKWGCCGGSSGNPCSETYRGTERASEPETQAFQDFFATVVLDQNGDNGDDELPLAAPDDATGLFLSLHSYQDEVLWPYGFAEGGAPNNAQLRTIGRKLAYYNGMYPSGFLYTVDGSTDDWTYGKFGIASFTFEVGPTYGSCGGFFPAFGCIDGIDGMPRDFWAENGPAFLFAHKIARTPYMTAYGPDTQGVAVNPAEVPQGTPAEVTANIADHRYGGDPLQTIASAEYFVDAPGPDGTGEPMSATDGSWGGLSEAVEATVDTSALEPGQHYVLVHGQNSNGDWGPFTAAFVDVTGVSDTLHVDGIKLRYLERNGRNLVYSALRIVDQDRERIPGALVDVEWTLPDGSQQSQQAVTNVRGLARYRVRTTLTGIFEICVTDVTKEGYLYDPSQNRETCDSLAVP